jgi:protein-tyrosine phosphatase
MAEFIMKKLVSDAGLNNDFYIASAATSTEEIGNPVYPPAREELHKHGLSCKGKYAVQLKSADYDEYDLFVTMDDWNMTNIRRIFRNDPDGKIHKLLTYAGRNDDVSDPWYTRRFDVAYADILEGCKALFGALTDRADR